MKITVLDGGTTNPGDLSWEEIGSLGELTVFADTPPELVTQRAEMAEAIIVNRIVLSRPVLRQLQNLRYIGTLSTGFNTIDLEAAREQGITVCNVPGYCEKTVAQWAFSLLLALCGHVAEQSALVRGGTWQQAVSYSQSEAPFFELSQKTLGILGYGSIGSSVAAIGRAMGMEVIVYSKNPKAIPTVSLETLFQKSDVLSIHCALNEDTRGLVNWERLTLMKPHALIINTARGGVINEADLAKALNEGIIGGAGLDVLSAEPPQPENPLLTVRNCIITPHVAWSSKEARGRLLHTVAENLRAYLAGTPQNLVNPL